MTIADPVAGEAWADRLARLGEPRMAVLEHYREELASEHGPIPHFDPDDGGVLASVLILLETPASRGGPVRFVSRDHATGTARNLTRFGVAAGLDRRRTLLWNVVPWVIHAPGERNRAPRRSEIDAGLAHLARLLPLLPALRVVVLAGRAAARAEALVAGHRPELVVLRMPHPSATYVNTSPAVAGRIVAALREAAALVAPPAQLSMNAFSSAIEAKR